MSLKEWNYFLLRFSFSSLNKGHKGQAIILPTPGPLTKCFLFSHLSSSTCQMGVQGYFALEPFVVLITCGTFLFQTELGPLDMGPQMLNLSKLSGSSLRTTASCSLRFGSKTFFDQSYLISQLYHLIEMN